MRKHHGVVEETSGLDRKAGPIIEAMRQRASEIAREEVDRTMKRIGADPEVEEQLAAMARALVSKLLHGPSARLLQASTKGRGGEMLMTAAVEMFGLAVEAGPPPRASAAEERAHAAHDSRAREGSMSIGSGLGRAPPLPEVRPVRAPRRDMRDLPEANRSDGRG